MSPLLPMRSTLRVLSTCLWAGSMVELYKANPLGFIKESQRLDAPVTSATCVFAEQQTVDFNVACCCSGPTPHDLPKGTLHQCARPSPRAVA